MPDATGRDTKRKRLLLWLGILLVAAGVVLLATWGGLKYRRVRTCLDSSQTRLRILQDLALGDLGGPADLNVAEAGAHLHGLQDDLACLQAEVGDFLSLAPLLGWLPNVGPDIASAPILLEMAQNLVDGGVLIFDSLSPLGELVQPGGLSASGPGWPDQVRAALLTLDLARPSLVAAEEKLQRAGDLQLELDAERLSPRLSRLLELTDRYLPLLRTGVGAAQLAPELLGAKAEQVYLVLAQNDDERRPTGGWISGLGLLTVAGGQITDVSFRDSWVVDNLEVPHDVPPDSMFRALWAGIWLFRDANWSPDFPTSAQVAERILERDQKIEVDGVIAVDQRALGLLVAALEPLAVESSEEPVTGANVLSFMRDSWAEPQQGVTLTGDRREWAIHRKDFMADLVGAMLEKVQAPSQTPSQGLDLTKLASAIWAGLQERHILVYLDDAEAAELLAAQQWDGALLETQGVDYLQIVDANVGFNKVDPNVQRTIVYHVDLTEPDQARAEVVIRYQNRSQRQVEACIQEMEWLSTYEERMHGCYWDYVRFYVPEGARLLTSEREPLPPGSLLSRYRFAPLGDAGPDTGPAVQGKAEFGLFFVVGPGEQRDVHLAWQLPAGLVTKEEGAWHYQLLVQKQSGTSAIPLRIVVSLPLGARLAPIGTTPSGVEAGTVTFDLSLATDQRIEVLFHDADIVDR